MLHVGELEIAITIENTSIHVKLEKKNNLLQLDDIFLSQFTDIVRRITCRN